MMSDFALNTSSPSRAKRVGKLRGTLALAGALVLGSAVALPVQAQGTKIGFVNTERILRESAPAKTAQSKIESEFKRRDDELQRLSNNLRAQAEKFDKDAPVLSESDRVSRQRELSRLDTELQRKRREFQEDFNRRRNEEFSSIVTKANQAIKRIAEQENYDLIVQDAVTVNPRVDITDKVIQALK
ncbi:OmpH family outer membrane protein [Bordetella petrii]|uniref:OmpH family outer membrane protein n=1 Tax=Bordetella petrii TaxID=94624 RepID=UPI0037335D77